MVRRRSLPVAAALPIAILAAAPLPCPAASPTLLLDQVVGNSDIDDPVSRNASTFVSMAGPDFGIARYHPTGGWTVIDAPPLNYATEPILVGNEIYFWGVPTYVDGLLRLYRAEGGAAIEVATSSERWPVDDAVLEVNGHVVFALDDEAHGEELWVSDGTPEGTELLLDLNPSGDSSPTLGAVANGYLYFSAYHPTHGTELWRTDGTPGGTTLVADLEPGADSSYPDRFTEVNGLVVFAAQTSLAGRELHRTDGTSGGTYLIRDVATGTSSSYPDRLMTVDGWVYFGALTDAEGFEPHRTNGNVIQLVRDVNPGTGYSWPGGFFAYDGEVYFSAYDEPFGYELWKTNGLSSGTSLVLDANPGEGSLAPTDYVELDGVLYYRGYREAGEANELWRTEGTPGTTSRIVLYPGVEDEDITAPFVDGSTLIVGATDGTIVGHEPRRYDPATGAVTLVADLNPETGGNNALLAPYGDDLIAVHDGYAWGRDLVHFYLDDPGAWRLLDTSGGRESHFPVEAKYAIRGEHVYFSQWQWDLGLEMAVYDGEDVHEVDVFPGSEGSDPSDLAVTEDGRCFFVARRADGTVYGLYRLTAPPNPAAVLVHPFGVTPPRELTALGNDVVFVAGDGGDEELWWSNGTETTRLRDLEPGPGGSMPEDLTVVGDVLFFTATTTGKGRELWGTDGSEEGTRNVGDLLPGGAGSDPGNLTAGYPFLYFTATTPDTGTEIWRATATAAEMLGEIVDGPGSGDPRELAVSGSRLRFSADDGSGRGREPWSLTNERTPQLTVDLNPGTGSSNPRDFGEHRGATYFTADNGSLGRELWRLVDGSIEVVSDAIAPGTASAKVGDRATVGHRLYFVAESAEFGREIWWVSDPGGAADLPSLPVPLGHGDRPTLALTVGPNPFVDHLDLRFRLAEAAAVRADLVDVSGRVVLHTDFGRLTAGDHTVSWPLGRAGDPLAAGIYFLRVEGGGATETRKILSVR